MGVSDLRKAFNEVAQPRYTCRVALLGYERFDGAEFQVLSFSGIGPDGNSFEVRSEKSGPAGDPIQIARATAQALLDKREPLT